MNWTPLNFTVPVGCNLARETTVPTSVLFVALHVKTGALQFLDGGFGFGMRFEDCHDCIVLGHHVCFSVCRVIADDTLGRMLAIAMGCKPTGNQVSPGVTEMKASHAECLERAR